MRNALQVQCMEDDSKMKKSFATANFGSPATSLENKLDALKNVSLPSDKIHVKREFQAAKDFSNQLCSDSGADQSTLKSTMSWLS